MLLFRLLKRYFYLNSDQQDDSVIAENVKQGVDFRGTNLWALVIAIFIASIGLNTNSTAVIIGAMLISPLMAPIVGIGFSIATLNLDLLKVSLRNFVLFVVISLCVACLYFMISPLSEVTPEIVARTYPTIYDVLIAFFGGMAGMVAATRKEKGSIIIGVAIATALMPPLCTVGFSLVTQRWTYALGAFYLFSINAVMISVAAFLVTKFALKVHTITFENKALERKATRIMVFILALTVLPSIYFAYTVVAESRFEKKVKEFIAIECKQQNQMLLSQTVSYHQQSIELFLMNKISAEDTQQLQAKLADYDLSGVKLSLKSAEDYLAGKQAKDNSALEQKNQVIMGLQQTIQALEQRLQTYETTQQAEQQTLSQNLAELRAIYEPIQSIGVASLHRQDSTNNLATVIVIGTKQVPPPPTQEQIRRLMAVKAGEKTVEVVFKVEK